MKISFKLGIFTAAVILAVIILVSYGVFMVERRLRIKEIEEEQETILRSFISLCEEALVIRDEIMILNNMRALKNTYPGIEYISFYNINTDRFRSTDDEKKDDIYAVRDIHDLWVEDDILSSPVYVRDNKAGIAQIGFSSSYYQQRIQDKLKDMGGNIFKVSFIAMLLGLALALFLSKTITSPVRKLTQGARYIGEGNLSTRIDIESKDEIGILAAEFNEMALKLAELDRAKDDFVNAVSHELRTPLAAIEGYIDLLIHRGKNVPDEKRNKALNIMKLSSQRLSHFIDDVLDMAKIKAGMMELEKEPCSVKDIIEKTIALLNSVAQKENIEIKTRIDEKLLPVFADPHRVNQVLTNLIGNALKFTPSGGHITVGAENCRNPFVKIMVKDTGPGIPQEDLGKIFRQFEQTGSARNIDGPKGTGLGLAIAKGIVDSHKGRIWVESAPGSGAEFYFTLPVYRK